MYRSENVSARTKSRLAKEKCFNRNIPILNTLFYIGNGFMLRKRFIALARIFYGINGHKANDMTADLLSHGLLVKKQATDTRTCTYIMTKRENMRNYEKFLKSSHSLEPLILLGFGPFSAVFPTGHTGSLGIRSKITL